MSLTIELPADVESNFARIAADKGITAEELARTMVLDRVRRTPSQSWDEIVAPIAADFAASGMTEEDLDALVEDAREEIYFEQHGRYSKKR